MGYLQTLAKALTGDGLVLPAPVRNYLKGQPQPLALDTRERLPEWCAAHGYSDEQRQCLHQFIRTLVPASVISRRSRPDSHASISTASSPGRSPTLSAKVPPKAWPPSR